MKTNIVSFMLLWFASASLHAESPPLFRMTSDAVKAADNNRPAMVFQEVQRSESSSTVEVVHTFGSVAAKSMFLLRGSCALMKERQRSAFRIERLSKEPIRLTVHFVSGEQVGGRNAEQAPGEDSVISAAFCDRIDALFAR
jgi:hypothetical protein